MASRVLFDFDTLTPAMQKLLPKVDAGVALAFNSAQAKAASHARASAPWTDRTGNARAGLNAQHVAEPMVKHSLVIYHSVPYGYWLEVRWSGRYAVIGPTMLAVAPELAAMVATAVNHAVRG